jgi:phosphoribosylformylglycinamidine cyclo-ligase
MGRYNTVGIDCVAMNVNDLLCVGATPISLVDYIALEESNPEIIDQLAEGLCEGAKQANVSISGGELAALRDIIKGPVAGAGFDLAASAIGVVPLDRIIIGQDVQDGDVLVGIESSGVHSNGLTLAREVLFQQAGFTVATMPAGFSHTIGEELLKPTYIYVAEVVEILRQQLPVRALAHITGDGFLNLSRVAAEVGFVIDDLPPLPASFRLIQEQGSVPDAEMFSTFNMGIGFCIVMPEQAVDQVIAIVGAHGKRAQRIGRAVADRERRITLPQYGLVGQGKRFVKA